MKFSISTNNSIINEFVNLAYNQTEAKKAIKDFAQMFGKLPSGHKKTVQEFLWTLFQETNKIRPIHIAKVNTAYQKVPAAAQDSSISYTRQYQTTPPPPNKHDL